MGRLEKVVVLTVLFLVALILGIALNPEDEATPEAALEPGSAELASAAPADPLAQRQVAPAAELGQPEPAGAQGLLSSQVESPRPAGQEASAAPAGDSLQPAADPGRSADALTAPLATAEPEFLRTTADLEPSRVDELMIYTWKAGDSFTALSDRYYGSRLETGRLRAANEGRDEATLAAGDKIFVPVLPAQAAPQAAGQWSGGTYVVESGDILGRISHKVYGSAARWRRIYDANRDVLSSPDDLKVGMRLRIPE